MQQKFGLAQVAADGHARCNGRLGNRGEIHPGGHVLDAGQDQWVAVRTVPEMAAQPAIGAVRSIECPSRHTVVEQQHTAALDGATNIADPVAQPGRHFGRVTIGKLLPRLLLDRADGSRKRFGRRIIPPAKAVPVDPDSRLHHLSCLHPESLDRDRVSDFVGNHDTAKLVRQSPDPLDPPGVFRYPFCNRCSLALLQLRRDFENPVAIRQLIEFGQSPQHADGERATACAWLENVAATEFVEHPCTLVGDHKTKKARDFRRGHEVSLCAELAAAGNVITETGRVKHRLHELSERDAAGADPLAQLGSDRVRVFGALGVGFGQPVFECGLHR